MDNVPLVRGGQGRSDESIVESAATICVAAVAALALGSLIALGYWVSGALGLVD